VRRTLEPTTNFAAGLELARNELRTEKKLDTNHAKVVGAILDKPVMEREGKKIRAMYRAHVRTRILYAKLTPGVVIGNLDWTKLVQWIKDHWQEIVRIILAIVPFIL
jgi:hypothetical protein